MRKGLSAFLLLAMSSVACGAEVTWRFSGPVYIWDPYEIGPIAGPANSYSVDFTFDPSGEDVYPGAGYAVYPGPTSATLTINGNSITTTFFASNIVVQNDDGSNPSQDRFDVSGFAADGTVLRAYLANLQPDPPVPPFSSEALPSAPPNPSLFSNTYFNWSFTDGQHGGYYAGTVESASYSPVPLPAAAWLLLSGLGGIAGVARRRRTSTQIATANV